MKKYILLALAQVSGAAAEVYKMQIYESYKDLLIVYAHTIGIRLYGSFKLALPLSIATWVADHLNGWYISNEDYVTSTLICISADYILGTIWHIKKGDASIKRNAIGLLLKLSMCACAVAVFESLSHTTRDTPLIYDYLKVVTRLIVLLYPAGSAFKNMSNLTNGKLPPKSWFTLTNGFQKDLDIKRLQGKEE